jgi:outer membrane protein assembly factor BamB
MNPILFESMVIAGNSLDGLVAYDRTSAKEIWRKRIDGGVEAGAELAKEHLYFGAGDGFFYKISALTGETVWSYPIRAEGLGKPLIHKDRIYFLAGNNIVHALDMESGRSVWIYNRRDPSPISVRGGSQPAADEKNIYVGFSDGAVVALAQTSGNVVWETQVNRNKRFHDVDSEPIIDGKSLFVAGFDHALSSLDLSTGNSNWQVEQGGYSSPHLQGSRLYLTSTNAKLIALEKANGQILWEKPLRSLGTQPIDYKGLLITGEYIGTLKFFDFETGELVKEFAPGRGVHSQVTLDGTTGEMYFMSADGNLFVLKGYWTDKRRLWPWEEQ